MLNTARSKKAVKILNAGRVQSLQDPPAPLSDTVDLLHIMDPVQHQAGALLQLAGFEVRVANIAKQF